MARHHRVKADPGLSQRQLRVGELVRHVLADLRLATIYVMPLGGQDVDVVAAALDRNKRFLRGEIARHINLKFAPEIRFAVDPRFDEADRIERLLRTPAVQRDLNKPDDDQS